MSRKFFVNEEGLENKEHSQDLCYSDGKLQVEFQEPSVSANTSSNSPSGHGAVVKAAHYQQSCSLDQAETSAESTFPSHPDDSIPNASCRYPLKHTWTFWYLEYDSKKSWEAMLNKVTSVDTANDFWEMHFRTKRPSTIRMGSDYSLFKNGIRPMWEDNANKEGGRWVISLLSTAASVLDKVWLDVQLCLIGQIIDINDQVCGAVVNVRTNINKISVWTSRGEDRESVLAIGHALRQQLKLNENVLHYELHKDVKAKNNSSVKPIYTL